MVISSTGIFLLGWLILEGGINSLVSHCYLRLEISIETVAGYLADEGERYLDGTPVGCLVELRVGILVGPASRPAWSSACESGY